jgi:hypothetical protein
LRWDDEDEIKKDRLFRDYDTVLKESAVLTTFGGVLFGFLLNISIRGANQLPYLETIILVLAFSPLIETLAYFVAGLPFLFVYILYRMRK